MVNKLVKTLFVNAGVCGYYGNHSTISGYIGHNWADDVGPETVIVDARGMEPAKLAKLIIAGPMLDPDLPPGRVSSPYQAEAQAFCGEAGGLDYVSLDVWVTMYEEAGARVIRGGPEALEFAKTISRREC